MRMTIKPALNTIAMLLCFGRVARCTALGGSRPHRATNIGAKGHRPRRAAVQIFARR